MVLCLNCGCVGHADDKGEMKELSPSLYCPNCQSDKDVIDVDEEIAWYIYKLNKAGFKTKFSCAGHPWEKYCLGYIVFQEDYPEIKEYFDKYQPKHLDLEINLTGHFKMDKMTTCYLTQKEIDESEFYQDNFIPDGQKNYTIRVKDRYEALIENIGDNVFIDDPNSLMIHHNFHSDMKNLVNRLCN